MKPQITATSDGFVTTTKHSNEAASTSTGSTSSPGQPLNRRRTLARVEERHDLVFLQERLDFPSAGRDGLGSLWGAACGGPLDPGLSPSSAPADRCQGRQPFNVSNSSSKAWISSAGSGIRPHRRSPPLHFPEKLRMEMPMPILARCGTQNMRERRCVPGWPGPCQGPGRW